MTILKLISGLVAVTSVARLGGYRGRMGLRLGDALSWIGAVLGVAGLVLAAYPMGASQRAAACGTNVQQRAEALGHGRVYQAGGDQSINER